MKYRLNQTTKWLFTLVFLGLMTNAYSFCGFYVAKAGAELFNNKSSVILARSGDHTTITMSSDYSGPAKDFAMVIPVPVVLKQHQIRVSDQGIFSRLDAYSAPRLVEYYDQSPCYTIQKTSIRALESVMDEEVEDDVDIEMSSKKHRVKIEAKYAVGEYDILILSAEESNGLKLWLTENEYQIPKNAERVLEPYIKDKLKFFVVKVNLKRKAQSGINQLRPIQISYESSRFMLPIRLGMANSTGTQDMIVYALTDQGRVECANYRTIEMPTNRKIPTFIKQQFGPFYRDLFNKKYKDSWKNGVFVEYAWNVSPSWGGVKCDPCVGPPPITRDLLSAGASWLSQSGSVFFTRLHVRYDEANFPQDLQLQVTSNKKNYQSRYVITHPAGGDVTCEAGIKYLKQLKKRRYTELANLNQLAGWEINQYTQYVPYGSGQQHQQKRKNETPIGGASGGSIPPPSTFLYFVLGIIGLIGIIHLTSILSKIKTV